MPLQDTDEWWRERRVLARKLLDLGEFQTAYQVVRKAALPGQRKLPGGISFHARLDRAWRYLKDPAGRARAHFRP